jgi:hypothetical protein
MRLTLIIAITISILAPHQREAPSVVGAETFVSSFGRFSIALPNPTRFGPLTIPTPFGNARGHLFQWETKEATFGVGYGDAAQPLDGPVATKQFFDGAVERFNKIASANSGNVGSVKQNTLDKYPGIEQRVALFTGSVIQRTYIASRRVYEIVAVMKNSQQGNESVAVGVLDSFKILSEADAQTKEAQETAKAEPSPLPQPPVAQRPGTDASDEGLSGNIRAVLTESEDLSGRWSVLGRKRNSFDTFDEQGNKLKSDFYDYQGNLFQVTVYGFIDGSRVSTFRTIAREYNPPPLVIASPPGGAAKKSDPRYGYRFEFKYDDKKRLTEKTWFHSDGAVWLRYVYKYNGSQKAELVYREDGSVSQRYLSTLDDKGNEVEKTFFEPDGSIRTKESYKYEFDSKGNWTKRTTSKVVTKAGRQQLEPYSVHYRTITYY